MKTNNRSTGLQAIMRTALFFVILLSFPTTIMAYEETLDNGIDQLKYTLSGVLKDQGKISKSRNTNRSGRIREDLFLIQDINEPLYIKAQRVSGESKNYDIFVHVAYFWETPDIYHKNGIKDTFKEKNGKFEKSINVPKGCKVLSVDIYYIANDKLSEFTVKADFYVMGLKSEDSGTQTPSDITNNNSNSNGKTPMAAQTGNATAAQTGNAPAAQTDNTIYDVAPTMPEFPGGAQAMGDYIAKNLKYPADAKQQGKEGFVSIQFVVEKDGSRSDVKVMRGKLPSMDNEALRVIKSMPKFSPGRNENNQPVRVKFVVPVRFKLN